MRGSRVLASPLLWVAVLFAGLVLRTDELKPVLHWGFPGVQPVIYQRSSFLALALSHFGLVAGASGTAILVGVSLAVFVTRPAGRDFRAMVNAVATIGQTFPPAAVLAITVPIVGFGARPTMIALFLYGLLPIVENAIAGLEGVPREVREAAEGIGLSLAAAARCRSAPGWPGDPFGDPDFGDHRHRDCDHRLDRRRLDARYSDL